MTVAAPHFPALAGGLAETFADGRARTEQLAGLLSAEDQTPQSMPDASPAKWHRAHTSWFFEEFLLVPTAGYRPDDPAFGYLFNSYYEAVGPRHPRPQRGLVTRRRRRGVQGHVQVRPACACGASCATPRSRNFFPAGARWACSGVRLARDAA